ncbi:hypothetical protein [Botryobacter ruber]|uniref:hypothetical protein n=1 Tax=Botryobacter ruber TaxID=2171629 RepID=UPI000E09E43D|nr:hypothetical protein [Botryobacter ruber]
MIYITGYLLFFAAIYFFAYKWEWKNNRGGVKDAAKFLLFLVGLLLVKLAFNAINNLTLDPEKYAHKFNSERPNDGLMKLPDGWKARANIFNSWADYIVSSQSDYRLTYASKSDSLEKNGFTAKTIEVRDGEIDMETDWFKMKNKKLCITYSYKDKSYFSYYTVDSSSTEIAKDAAVDTLRVWGIKK